MKKLFLIKRFSISILLICLVISFAACGGGGGGGDPHAHSYGEWTVKTAATCTEDAVEKRTCSCGDEQTRNSTTNFALGHDRSGSWFTKAPEGYLYKTCQRIGCAEELRMDGEMAKIPAGTVKMGPIQVEGDDLYLNVTFNSGFFMSKYLVTQELYQLVMGANPSYFTPDNGKPPATGEVDGKRPVESVSWYDAIVFCNKLSIIEGLTPVYKISGSTDPDVWITAAGGAVPIINNPTWDAVEMVSGASGYRLPTEVQWEYACRAGSTTSWYFGDTESDLVNYAWYDANANAMTHQVGLKTANAWGLYDMHGNVWEWCWDWFDDYPDSAEQPKTGEWTGPSSTMDFRVVRGGAWTVNLAGDLFSAYRIDVRPEEGGSHVGFRVVRL